MLSYISLYYNERKWYMFVVLELVLLSEVH